MLINDRELEEKALGRFLYTTKEGGRKNA